MNELIPGERVISSSADKKLAITSHRVCYSDKTWGRSFEQQIMLEQVSSCEHYYGTRPMLLLVVGLFILLGAAAGINNEMSSMFAMLATAAGAGLIYLLSRHSTLIIGSSSAKIRVNVLGLSSEEILHFIAQLHRARNEQKLEQAA